MNKIAGVFALMSMVILSGCATARLATGPDVYALAEYPAATRVGIAPVADARGTNKAGSIGACGIKIKGEELSLLATNYLLDGVSRYLKTNVVRIKDASAGSAAKSASGSNADYVMLAKIAELKMSSVDALLQPVEVSCRLDLAVYDRGGKQVLDKTFTGSYQERIGLSVVDKATGKLAEKAVQDAVSNVVKEPELQALLKKK